MKFLLFTFLLSSLASYGKFKWEDYYSVENIPLPKDADPQVGGLVLTKDNNIAVCLHRGEILIYDTENKTWSKFAEGLHEPLGLYAEDDGSFVVVQRAELTHVIDEDGDGKADTYKVLCDDWGVSGNYHEFTFGLVKDSKGRYYIALGTASNGSGVREIVRGEWNDNAGLTHDKFLYGGKHGSWSKKKKIIPRMYSRVPYRGCVLQITPGDRKAKVYATGFRTPNGVYLDENDQLWISDNQGDWLGASKLHKVNEGGFYGHVASLLWSEDPPDVLPTEVPTAELNERRTKSVLLLPQGECSNSPSGILPLKAAFAPLNNSGALVLGELNSPRMPLYLPDTVNGTKQGTAMHFLDTTAIDGGINRMAYAPDGKTLYVGKTHLSWPGKEGINKITYNGKPYFQMQEFKLTPTGFEMTLNDEVADAYTPADYSIESFQIQYHSKYGSPKARLKKEPVASVKKVGSKLIIDLKEKPKADRVYGIQLPKGFSNTELGDISSSYYWYTAHVVYD